MRINIPGGWVPFVPGVVLSAGTMFGDVDENMLPSLVCDDRHDPHIQPRPRPHLEDTPVEIPDAMSHSGDVEDTSRSSCDDTTKVRAIQLQRFEQTDRWQRSTFK